MRKEKGISANLLKWIAMITMLIDHIGATILEKNPFYSMKGIYTLDYVLRLIGRISFPIFCFLLVEGFIHTRDVKKYIRNMAVFALLSEYPFDLALAGKIYWSHQNVFWTLLIGLIVLYFVKKTEESQRSYKPVVIGGIALLGAAAAWLLRTDYKAVGVLLIFILYMTRKERKLQCIAGAVCMLYEYTSVFAFPLIYFYNGIRKKGISKYVFYVFYPVHLLILYGIYRFLL